MKNVMTRAWEIAREGAKKFGGKVKEYFQQALVMAWKEFKNAVDFGLQIIGKKNGSMFIVVNDIEGLQASLVYEEKNFYNGKMVTKKKAFGPDQVGVNNKTGQKVRMYKVAIHCGDIEFKVGDKVEVLENSRKG